MQPLLSFTAAEIQCGIMQLGFNTFLLSKLPEDTAAVPSDLQWFSLLPRRTLQSGQVEQSFDVGLK